MRHLTFLIIALMLCISGYSQQWSVKQANDWYAKQPWLVGCNFLPSTAINQIEMWQSSTWDEKTIKKELDWAADLGFNTVRVYLHDLVYRTEKKAFLKKMNLFLEFCAKRNIKPLFVFFDDCHYAKPEMGKQPEPVPGVHNSGWKQSPGYHTTLAYEKNTISKADRKALEKYVKGVLTHFKNDDRILGWDVYNEVGQSGNKSTKLLLDTWEWAWKVRPLQPLTACVAGAANNDAKKINARNSDVYSFHNYSSPEGFRNSVAHAVKEAKGRPIFCTEYMARTTDNTFQNCMPTFKEKHIACWNWGFVDGKSATKWAWSSRKYKPGDAIPTPTTDPKTVSTDPPLWFHDIFRLDGTPYKKEEVKFIKEIISKK
ncbi:1,4-beta-xylanase [Prolixibacteraceae bacterium JC049]|nr:1,4-beta-xylanase [Prolixibacteraceae bacterium JC049]